MEHFTSTTVHSTNYAIWVSWTKTDIQHLFQSQFNLLPNLGITYRTWHKRCRAIRIKHFRLEGGFNAHGGINPFGTGTSIGCATKCQGSGEAWWFLGQPSIFVCSRGVELGESFAFFLNNYVIYMWIELTISLDKLPQIRAEHIWTCHMILISRGRMFIFLANAFFKVSLHSRVSGAGSTAIVQKAWRF